MNIHFLISVADDIIQAIDKQKSIVSIKSCNTYYNSERNMSKCNVFLHNIKEDNLNIKLLKEFRLLERYLQKHQEST